MSLRFLTTILAVIISATANAQLKPPEPATCNPLPPSGMFTFGDKLTPADDWRFELWTLDPGAGGSECYAELRQVTGGVVLNWIGDPPTWAMDPAPDMLLTWEPVYGAYCRFASEGASATTRTHCRAECVWNWNGGLYYTGLRFVGEWRVTTATKLGRR